MDITKILFLDIETVGTTATYNQLPERLQPLWDHKSKFLSRGDFEDMESEALFPLKAGIFAEFGRIVCISVGIITGDPGNYSIRIKSYYGDDERQLLSDFADLLDRYYNDFRKHFLCGHNIREFDIPYICRRLIVNKISLPSILNIHGRKAYELDYMLDTLKLWKFGDYKHYTSLDLLAAIFNIPSPKSDMDGSQVHNAYWEDQALENIKKYCEKDVVTTIQVFLHMKGFPQISTDNVTNL